MSIDTTVGVIESAEMPDTSGPAVGRRGLLGLLGGAGVVALAAATASPAHAEEPATGATTFNVLDFGATGDGTTDDTAAFRTAIDAVAAANGGILHVPVGVYIITGPINLTSNMALVGEGGGSIIRAASDRGWTTSDRLQGMINIVSERNVIVRDLELDQHSSDRESTHYVQYTMMINDAADCLVTDVTFRDAGLPPTQKADGSWNVVTGPILGLFAQDQVTAGVGGGAGSVVRVRVSRCNFLQDGAAVVQFGVRVRSEWDKDRPLEELNHENSGHVFEDCLFSGAFPRDVVELAGRVTHSNHVVRCRVTGEYSTAIDLDKGASHNVVAYNHMDHARQPAHVVPDPNVLFMVMADHGNLYSSSYGPWLNTGNVMAYNTIRAVDTPESSQGLEAAIFVAGVADSQVIGNVVDGYNGGRVGGGLRLDVDSVANVLIQGNRFRNVHWGIRTNAQERPEHYQNTLHNVTIDDNVIEANNRCVWLSTFTPGGRNFRLVGNTFKTASATAPCVETGHQDAAVISGNALEGGSVGIQQNSPMAVLSNNVVRGTSQAGFDIRVDSTLIGNVTRDEDQADLIVADGIFPTLIGNTFVGTSEGVAPRTSYGTEVPTSGAWRRGDTVRNTAPSQVDPLGWICVNPGSPGRWVPLPRPNQR